MLKTLVQNHPLIPRGHRTSVLRGLVAGLDDDFLVGGANPDPSGRGDSSGTS